MSGAQEIIEVLGGPRALARKVRSLDELLELVRGGLPFAALEALMRKYGLKRETVCEIVNLSERNFPRRKKQKQLSPEESDRLYRLARILAHAQEVFEDPETVTEWIRSPNIALGKQDPLSLLDTDIGVQQVDQILGRIEHGIPA